LLSFDELHFAPHGREYGVPWVEYNFFGPSKIAESLRKIASHFDDKIKDNARRSSPATRSSATRSSPNTVRVSKARR